MNLEAISGVLLAGGQSRRMGQDKRRLSVGGQSLFCRVLSVFEELFAEVIVVVAEQSTVTEGLNHKVVTDLIPGKGPMGGLYTGLSYCTKSSVFVAACDMPFLRLPLMKRICETSKNYDATVVRLSIGIQPMQGVYSKKCLPILKEMIDMDQLGMRSLLSRSELTIKLVDEENIKDLDPNCVSFMNINTPSDLEMANKLCRS